MRIDVSTIALVVVIGTFVLGALYLVLSMFFVFKGGFVSCVSMLGVVIAAYAAPFIPGFEAYFSGAVDFQGRVVPIESRPGFDVLAILIGGALMGMLICGAAILWENSHPKRAAGKKP